MSPSSPPSIRCRSGQRGDEPAPVRDLEQQAGHACDARRTGGLGDAQPARLLAQHGQPGRHHLPTSLTCWSVGAAMSTPSRSAGREQLLQAGEGGDAGSWRSRPARRGQGSATAVTATRLDAPNATPGGCAPSGRPRSARAGTGRRDTQSRAGRPSPSPVPSAFLVRAKGAVGHPAVRDPALLQLGRSGPSASRRAAGSSRSAPGSPARPACLRACWSTSAPPCSSGYAIASSVLMIRRRRYSSVSGTRTVRLPK